MARHINLPSAVYLGEPYRWLYEALPRLPWAALSKTTWSARTLRHFIADLFVTHGLRIQVREEIDNAEAFDSILVNSLYSRESVQRAYGLESTVCYLGIDVTHFQPSGESRERFVLGMGNLSPAKGPDRAIRAIAEIAQPKRPTLIWVGNTSDAAYERYLTTLASELGVQLSIKILVSDSELRSLLSRASMLLYTPRLEPFGLAPLEANACGTPVVAIAEGGVRETIQPGVNGLLVNGDSAVELAKAIERLLDDVELSGRMGRQAVDHVHDNWSMPNAIDRLEDVLCELVDR